MAKRVCVIGAGPAGLASLRYLTENPGVFDVIAFEQTREIGGTWAYEENDGTDKHGRPVHSAMYPDLVTNFPTAIMDFPGFPYPDNLPCFVHNSVVRQYLEDFCERFSLRKYIQLESKVVNVKPTQDGNHGNHKWEVEVEAAGHGSESALTIYHFDAIMICNGRFSTPCLPTLPGLDTFRGDVRHSREYRHPEAYTGKTVAVMSGGLSAMDITISLIRHAKHVYQCRSKGHHKLFMEHSAENLTNCSGIKEVKASSIILEGGSELEVDALLLCTGYRFCFPFLDQECRPEIENNRILHLYKHVVNTEHPTMGFISTGSFIRIIDLQARFFIAALSGQMALPTREEMKRYAEEDYQSALSQGIATKHYHLLVPPRLVKYTDDLASTADIAPIPRFYYKAFLHVLMQRAEHFSTFRMFDYKVTGDGMDFISVDKTKGVLDVGQPAKSDSC